MPNQELAYHEAKDCIARLRIEKGEDYDWEEADDAGKFKSVMMHIGSYHSSEYINGSRTRSIRFKNLF